MLGPTELTVYNGTATNQYIPMYGYYFDNYTKSEYIIPASQLTDMVGGTISAITFYPSSVATTSSTWTNTSQTVFIKEVSSTTLGGSYSGTTGATVVKQALLDMPTAGTAYTITFDTPYTYNGGNLLIGVYNTNKGSYNKVEWYGTSNLTSGVSAYGNNSSSLNSVGYNAQSFLPKTTFTYMPAASADPVAITVSANPTEGGTVTGAGTYDPGTTATLTATANEGYTFTNWTKNGVVISTNTTYSFTVSTAATYVANFTLNSYTITATAVPAEGGTVTVGSSRITRDDLVYDFENGWQEWTTFQGTTGNSPHSWMHNTEYTAYDSNGNQIVPACHNSSSGMMLSESYISASTSGGNDAQAVIPDNYLVSPQIRLGGSITFYAASRMSNYYAEKFSVLVSESGNNSASNFTHTELTVTLTSNSWNQYTVDLSAYSGMGYVAIRHFDCTDQHLLYIDDITIVEGEDQSSDSGNFNHGETCVVTAIPNEGYGFVNWTENGAAVSSDASYTFTVDDNRDLVANFALATQTVNLVQGCNWWTPTKAMTLEQLEAALGGNAVLINTQDAGFARYENGQWSGTLMEIAAGQMYKIETTASVSLTLSGEPATGVSLTLLPGYNWFGYTGTQAKDIATALVGFTPTNGDTITAQDGTTITYSNGRWNGAFTLTPGHGYVYNSKATQSSTLSF